MKKRARVTFLEAWTDQNHTTTGLAPSAVGVRVLASVWLEFEAVVVVAAEWSVERR